MPLLVRVTEVLAACIAVVLLTGCPKDRSEDAAQQAPKPAAVSPAGTQAKPIGDKAGDQGETAPPPPATKGDDTEPVTGNGAQSMDEDAPSAAPSLPPGAVDLGDGRIAIPMRVATVTPLEKANRDIIAKWQNYNSVSAKFNLRYDQKKEGAKQDHNTAGTFDCLKKDGRILVRLKSFAKMVIERRKDDFVMTGERLDKIFDGEFLYVLQDIHTGRFAFKRRPNPGEIGVIGGPPLLATIHSAGSVTLAPDEPGDGFSTYVFKTLRRDGQTKADYYVDRETGLLRRLHVQVERLLSDLTITYSDFELNPAFADDYFTFKLPEGIELRDSTETADGATAPPPPPTP